MSTFEAKVYKLTIEEHPNADAIELARVGDYVSIVKKGQFKTGDLGIYIPEAAIVPEWLLKEIGLEGKLAGKDKNRVKAMKLRGILSQGLIYPIDNSNKVAMIQFDASDVTPNCPYGCLPVKEGDDVTELLGITKYIPTIPTSMSGEVFNAFGKTLKFDIENIKRYPDIIECCEEVTFTEKLHGTWCCFGYHPEIDHPVITSKGLSDKGLAFKINEENEKRNLYVKMFNSIHSEDGWLNILELFLESNDFGGWDGWEAECGNKPFYILGEIFGAGVQDLTYGNLPTQFRIFDIYVGEPGHGTYMDVPIVQDTVNDMNSISVNTSVEISYVPVLYRGPFSKKVLDEYTNGKETVSGSEAHMREGIVVRPIEERRNDEIGRVILKSVSEAYLLRKGKTSEYT